MIHFKPKSEKPMKIRNSDKLGGFGMLVSGGILLFFSLVLIPLSRSFSNEIPLTQQPVILFVSLLVSMGLVFLAAVFFSQRYRLSVRMFSFVLVIGFLMRGVLFFSDPILEDDFYRYFWDGKVLLFGYSPYRFAPADILSGKTDVPDTLRDLGDTSQTMVARINHPDLTTIYPPAAQAAFALAAWIRPFHPLSWRLVLLVFDLLAFLMILKILKSLSRPAEGVVIFWWNPLFIVMTYNTLHMEAVLLAFVIGAMYFTLRKRNEVAALALALASGVKIWPILLFPLVVLPVWKNPKRFFRVCLVFFIAMMSIFYPFISQAAGSDSGLAAFSRSWENNSGFFRIVLFLSEKILVWMNVHPGHGQRMSRILTGILVIFATMFFSLKKQNNSEDVFRSAAWLVGFLFLFIPTGFPWYYLWVLPFLVVSPEFCLLIGTALLPFYYLRYYLEPRNLFLVFQNYISGIEFLPIWGLIVYRFFQKRRI